MNSAKNVFRRGLLVHKQLKIGQLSDVCKIVTQQRCSLYTSNLLATGKYSDEIYTIDKPFKYVSQALKALSKIRDLDNEFDEFEFLDGCKQAIIHVSEKLAAGEFNDLKDVLTVNGMESLMELYNSVSPKTTLLKVDESDIIVVVPVKAKQEVCKDSGTPYIYILVDCCCKEPRVVQCSFRRNIDQKDSQWLVDGLNYLKGVKKGN